MKEKIKNGFVIAFYIFGFIGMLDMASHACKGPCLNPLMYIIKGITK